MKHLLSVSTFCLALLFCGSAIPGRAEIVFTYGTGGGTSDISISGSVPGTNDTVTYLTSVLHTLTITGVPHDDGTYSGLYLTEYYCSTGSNQCLTGEAPNVFYVTGSISQLNIFNTSFSNALVAITLGGSCTSATPYSTCLTGTTTSGGNFTLNAPTDVVSVSVNSTLSADLGLSQIPMLAALANMDSGGNPSYTNLESATVDLETTYTPEPRTWLMMTLGLSLIALAARRKSSRMRN